MATKKKKTEFQVTEEEAKSKVLETVRETGIYDGEINDEWFRVAGILDMDDSWNMVQS